MDAQLKKILVIEDDQFIRELYTRTLQKEGFAVLSAEDGAQGLDLVRQQPNLVLLDIMLPKLNGLEFLKTIKADPALRPIPVLLLTNLGQTDVIDRAFALEAQGYLMKMRSMPGQVVEYVKKFLADPNFKMDMRSLDLE